jgi:hypothetical protein
MTMLHPNPTTAEIQVVTYSLQEHLLEGVKDDVISEIAEKITLIKNGVITREDAINEITSIVTADFPLSREEAVEIANGILTVLGKPA